MNINININTDNAAFEGDFDKEIKRILKQTEKHISKHANSNCKLFDSNGNTCGNLTTKGAEPMKLKL